MFKSLKRTLDLILVSSDRARQAQMASRATGLPMALMYDRGLDVLACDIRPEFKTGQPPFNPSSRYIVVEELEHGAFTTKRQATYDAGSDSWLFNGNKQKRTEADLWLHEADYQDAFINACVRAEMRCAGTVE